MLQLSIITINYNNAAGLEKTIQSVVAQTFSDFEYLVIDGGSTDTSPHIIRTYSNHITYSVSEKDNGIYHAMNKGILQAKGMYCLFLNSGDMLVNDSVLKKVFSTPACSAILFGELLMDNGTNKRILEKLPAVITLPHLFYHNVWHPSSFIKTSLLKELGLYKEHFRIAADYEFFFHAFIIKKVSAHYLPFPISIFDTTGMSQQKENFGKILAEREEVKRNYLDKATIFYFNKVTRFQKNAFSRVMVNSSFFRSIGILFIRIFYRNSL